MGSYRLIGSWNPKRFINQTVNFAVNMFVALLNDK